VPNQTLLIVDDSADVHALVGAWLADEPVDLHAAYDGASGVAMARRLRPDLILLDVEMPGAIDGFAACALLKADPDLRDVPVVFLSGASTTDEKLRGLDLGASDYVTKPFDPAELRARVRASLRTKQLLDLLAQKAVVLAESEERFRIIAENSSDMISRHDAAGRFLYVSPACRAVVGHAAEDLVGRSVHDLVHPDDVAAVADCYRIPATTGPATAGPASAVFRMRHRAGHDVWCESTFRLLTDAAGAVREVHCSARDVTARKRVEDLEQGRADVLEMVARDRPVPAVMGRLVDLAERLYPGAIAGVVATADNATLLHAPRLPAPVAAALASSRPVNGGEVREVVDGDADVAVFDPAGATAWDDAARAAAGPLGLCWASPIRSGRDAVGLGAFWLFHPVPHTRAMAVAPAVGPDDLGRSFLRMATRLIAVAVDHHHLNAELAYRAQHDVPTGLPNRTLYDARLAEAIARADARAVPLTLAIIDVDRFKDVNDALGQTVGDAVLLELVARVRRLLGPADDLARIGGDEFALILPGLTTAADVEQFGQAVTDAFRRPFDAAGQQLLVTVSVGFAMCPRDGADGPAVGASAVVALRAAKSAGRGRARCYAPVAATVGAHVGDRLDLEACLRRALELNQLHLHYQPKVDAQDRVVGLEALARWRSPSLGDVPPGRFIPLAEEMGLVRAIDRWVLREAARQWRAWTDAGLAPVPVAVNLSAAQFAAPELAATLADAMSTFGVPPGALELELTEGVLAGDRRKVRARLEDLKRVGVTLAIGNFGTGSASPVDLQHLPLDVLKIDRALVGGIDPPGEDADRPTGPGGPSPSDSDGSVVVRSVAAMAARLGLAVVAEGVETERQRRFLLGIGCQVHQGFLYSRPLATPAIGLLLRGDRITPHRTTPGPLPLARSA
jgi:diguanylate cyclase (GGDEF)-like protein/PAS domain S-box-containing protein